MNALMKTANAALTMSSREIAELTGKQHRNVLRDATKMLIELHGERGSLRFEQTYQHAQNQQEYTEFLLPKRETLILVSGYSITLRAKIIDRWQGLEEQVKAPASSSTSVTTEAPEESKSHDFRDETSSAACDF